MAENYYVDLEATEKEVSSIVKDLADIIRDGENNDKFITVEKKNQDGAEEENLCHLVAKPEKEVEKQKIEVNINEIPIGDGNNWVKKSDWKIGEVLVIDKNSKYAYREEYIGTDKGNRVILTNKVSGHVNEIDNSNNLAYGKIALAETGQLIVSGNTRVYLDGEDSRLTLHDHAKVDFNQNCIVKMGNHSNLIMESTNPILTSINNNEILAPTILMHSGIIEMACSDRINSSPNPPPRYGPAEYMYNGKQGPILWMHGNSTIITDHASLIQATGNAHLVIEDESKFYMHSYYDVNSTSDSRKTMPSPVVMLDTTQFLFSNSDLKIDFWHPSWIGPVINYEAFLSAKDANFEFLKTTASEDSTNMGSPNVTYNNAPYPGVCIQGDTRIIIGGNTYKTNTENVGRVHMAIGGDLDSSVDISLTPHKKSHLGIKIGSFIGSDLFLDITGRQNSKTYIKIGGDSSAHLVLNITPANLSRTWININPGMSSKFQWIMDSKPNSNFDCTIHAGAMQFILTDDIFVQMSSKAHVEMHNTSTFVMRGPLDEGKKPWEDAAEYDTESHTWVRPMQIRDKSPLLYLADASGFVMHGKYEYEKSDTEPPEWWKSEVDKQDNAPLIEVYDDTELRLGGNFKVKTYNVTKDEKEDVKIVISNNKNKEKEDEEEDSDTSVSFTISQLKILKEIIKWYKGEE